MTHFKAKSPDDELYAEILNKVWGEVMANPEAQKIYDESFLRLPLIPEDELDKFAEETANKIYKTIEK